MPRHLLMLGSSLPDDTTLQAAVAGLAALGTVQPLTAVLRLPDRSGSGRRFFNQLLQLHSLQPRDTLRPALKRLEAALGRGPGEDVAIDIDLLACAAGHDWYADPHALAKGEFAQDPAAALLLAAGLQVRLETLPD